MAKKSSTEDSLHQGDKVEWQSSQGTISGSVKKKLTAATDIHQHHVAATPDKPQYLVVSDKTGAVAAHKPAALKRKSK